MLIIKTKISITIQPKIVCAEFILWLASHSPPFMPLKTVNPYFPPNNHSSSCFTLVWAEVRREVKIKSSSTTVHLASSTSHHIWKQRPSLYSVSPPRSSSLTQLFHCHTPKMLLCHTGWEVPPWRVLQKRTTKELNETVWSSLYNPFWFLYLLSTSSLLI